VGATEAAALSTYTFAALRGLELDLLATDDRPRLQRAFNMLEEDLTDRVELLLQPTQRSERLQKRRTRT
jgi:hypothetical protein